MSRKLLACRNCQSCTTWEVGAVHSGWWGGFGTAWAHPTSFLKCKTCGLELPVTISVDPHEHLEEVDEEAAEAPPAAVHESGRPCGCDPGANWTCAEHRASSPVYVPIQDDPIGDIVLGGIVGAALADAFEAPAVVDTPVVDVPMPDTSFDATGFSGGDSGGGGGGSDY